MNGTTTNDHSLTRQQRLSGPSAFDHVFKNGQRTADRFFTILYRDNELGYARIGFAVAKKRIRKAVGRNLIRRLTKESFRMAKSQVGSIDVVVMAKNAAATAGNEEIFKSLEKHWQKVENSTNDSP